MKVTLHRESFLAAFSQAAAVAPSKSTKDVLLHVLLEVKDGQAHLVATDLEQSVRLPVSGVEVDRSGQVLLPINQFGAILRESPDELLRLETDAKQNLLVKGQRSQHKLASYDPEEFPQWGEREGEEVSDLGYHEIPSTLLAQAIRRTTYATDEDSARYALGGIMLELDDRQITAVATDGRRLAKLEGPATSHGQDAKENHIAPVKGMRVLGRLLADLELPVRVTLTSNWIRCEVPDRFVFKSRLLEGRFPQWRQVIPGADTTDVTLIAGEVESALRQVLITAKQVESPSVLFSFKSGTLSLQGESETGKSEVEMPVSFYGDKSLAVTLNPQFVRDCLKTFSAEATLTMRIVDSETAVVFTDDSGFLYVVMPLSPDR